ncbi:unnamed protein product [Mytilus coruscus]|uniref:B box-type domain-containing protein n=1 Tax=Mytilus coruscus TaxID=42192 RepID=A0A6J8BTH5_MYTCO|nr:unnamed protein product [Mytilus coruscus]
MSDSCNMCRCRRILKPSVYWCRDCKKGLCGKCRERHNLSSVNHKTILIEEFNEFAQYVDESTEFCDKHCNEYLRFCSLHEQLCCKQCLVENHKDCTQVIHINDVLKNIKMSAAFQEINGSIEDIVENIKRMEATMETQTQKTKSIMNQVKETRAKINTNLDEIENILLRDSKEINDKVGRSTQELNNQLDKMKNKLTKCQTCLKKVNKDGTELQTFLTMKRIEKEINQADSTIHCLIEGYQLDKVGLKIEIQSELNKMIQNVDSFGCIINDNIHSDIPLVNRKMMQAQIVIPLAPKRSIDNITLNLQKTIKTCVETIEGCILLPNGKVVLSCFQQGILTFLGENGETDFNLSIKPRPYGITSIDNNTIAVSAGGCSPNVISVVNTDTKSIENKIFIDSEAHGIVFNEGRIIFCAGKRGIRIVNLKNNDISTILECELDDFTSVTTFDDNIYFTDRNAQDITCCDFSGNVCWNFHERDMLTVPKSLAVDNNGNICVADMGLSKVLIISPDGKEHKQLLSSEDGLRKPTSLFLNKDTNQLIIANMKDQIMLYRL